ncbi:hypothetical protein AB0O76_21990 [Streptomyces sp. NPDC086554]|uniref:hypothetical protein n=1 Tax=Streptomyces sp. NPDC086554 TaxID=3154864 RepID=UPI003442541D
MGRSGRAAAAVAAAVLIGFAGPAGTATAVHAVPTPPIVTTIHADGPGATTAPAAATTSPSSASGTPGTTSAPGVAESPAPDGTMADTGAGVLPWIALAGAAALGVGAVAFAMVRRRAD